MVRILLADDHAVVRRGLRLLLESRQGFEVCAEASDGREAVELTLHHKPDVAILDISLSVVNGIEATRKIRKESPGTEVMIFTLYHRENEIRDVLHAGARGYVLQSEADEQIVRFESTSPILRCGERDPGGRGPRVGSRAATQLPKTRRVRHCQNSILALAKLAGLFFCGEGRAYPRAAPNSRRRAIT